LYPNDKATTRKDGERRGGGGKGEKGPISSLSFLNKRAGLDLPREGKGGREKEGKKKKKKGKKKGKSGLTPRSIVPRREKGGRGGGEGEK